MVRVASSTRHQVMMMDDAVDDVKDDGDDNDVMLMVFITRRGCQGEN